MNLRLLAILVLGTVCFVGGCGTSGSNPVVVRELRFSIVSADGAAPDVGFEVAEVAAGGRSDTSLAGLEMHTSGVFSIFVEGADTPYRLTVIQRGPHPVHVRAGLTGGPLPTPNVGEINDAVTTGDGTSATIGAAGITVEPARGAVRVDVCSPLSGACSIPDNLGVPGVDFSGTIGDTETTRLIGRLTSTDPPVTAPAIFLLFAARDTLSAVLRSNSSQPLRGSIVIDGRIVTTDEATTHDVVLKADL